MPEVATRADSLQLFLSGAGVDDGAQAVPDDSLGNFRSSTEVQHLGFIVTNPITNITILFVAGKNGESAGTLTATGASEIAWTPPGGVQGTPVTIANGESKILEGGSGDIAQFIRVTRTSGASLSGTATVDLLFQFNNVIGFDNVSSAEAAAGDTEHRAFFFKNVSASQVQNLIVYIATLGTQRISSDAQLPSSGAGTITIGAGDFSDWPSEGSGFCRIQDNGGTLKEIVYYSSRTATSLTVPASGRGLLGTSAVAGAADDTLDAVPGIRIGSEAPSVQPTGFIEDISGTGEGTIPSSPTFVTGIIPAEGDNIGNLAAGEIFGLWIQRVVPVGAISAPSVLQQIFWDFDAA